MAARPTRKQIAKAAVLRMKSGVSSKKLARELAAYLLAEKRTSDLQPLMRDIIKVRAKLGTIEATAVSANQLSPQVQSALMKMATHGYKDYDHVILNQDRDPALVGGVRLSSIDSELDLSLRSRLKSLTQQTNSERI